MLPNWPTVLVTPRPDIPHSLVVSCKGFSYKSVYVWLPLVFSFLWDCDKQMALVLFALFLTLYYLLSTLKPLTESGCIAQDGLEHQGSCSRQSSASLNQWEKRFVPHRACLAYYVSGI